MLPIATMRREQEIKQKIRYVVQPRELQYFVERYKKELK